MSAQIACHPLRASTALHRRQSDDWCVASWRVLSFVAPIHATIILEGLASYRGAHLGDSIQPPRCAHRGRTWRFPYWRRGGQEDEMWTAWGIPKLMEGKPLQPSAGSPSPWREGSAFCVRQIASQGQRGGGVAAGLPGRGGARMEWSMCRLQSSRISRWRPSASGRGRDRPHAPPAPALLPPGQSPHVPASNRRQVRASVRGRRAVPADPVRSATGPTLLHSW